MYNPRLNELHTSREIITRFKGYENNPVVDENAFWFTENAGVGAFPALSPRNKRMFFNIKGEALHGLASKNKLVYINNGSLYYNAMKVTDLYFPHIEEERKFVSMGAKLIIFPDKVYVNTADFSDYGSLEASFKSTEAVTVGMCKSDGDLYEAYTISSAPTENPTNGDLWLDTSTEPRVLRQFYETINYWQELSQTYIRIDSKGIGLKFNQYDGVSLWGFENEELNGSHVIRHKGDDFIVITGIIDEIVAETDSVKVERKVPDMDFVCEYANRLWGCSSKTNEIFASKLGDPANFNTFMGISTDSYAVNVGSDGPFTAATSYRGYLLFFKENCVHKIYGQNPPYTLVTSYIRGVQKGSHGSVVCLNETLYYKSVGGVVAYEGGVPICISGDLGDVYYTDAVAGACFNRYYICMSDKNGERSLFAYDEDKGLWYREDKIDIREFAQNNCNLYFIMKSGEGYTLGLIDGENVYGELYNDLKDFSLEEDFNWSYESGLWGLGLPENKYYSNVSIRACGTKGARLSVWFELDSSKVWVKQLDTVFDKTGSLLLPFITPRCDHLRIKIQGKGDVKIYSVSRKIESGSELNV